MEAVTSGRGAICEKATIKSYRSLIRRLIRRNFGLAFLGPDFPGT
jgi:hypothetical protein